MVKPSFAIRGLEIHNSRMWRWSAIDSALEMMQQTELNTLILHQNDLIDSLVFPPGYIDPEILYTRWPILRSTLASNRLYMQQVVRHASSAGISVFFEVKELWFPDQLVELMPELRSANGAICPTHPFWDEFLERKVEALLEALPALGGLIVSPATRESKASIATRSCDCERCATTSPGTWYERVLRAMHTPLATQGKTLVVRDFAYTSDEQSVLVAAASAVSTDIVIALKNVPHDFWPTFPDNPMIGAPNGLTQWVEFDVLGQYCGLGVIPCSLVDDLRRRLAHSADRGVTGVWFRTDWELINDMSVFNSLNLVNLYAGAKLALDPAASSDEVYEAWAEHGLTTALQAESMQGTPERLPASAIARVQDAMQQTWPIVERALYTRGHVFQYSSKIAPTLDDFFYVPQRYHSREQWDPGSLELVAVTPENLTAILAEKEEARRLAHELRDSLDVEGWGLSAALTRDISETFDLFVLYVDLYRYVVSAGFLSAHALETLGEADRERARGAVEQLGAFRASLEERMAPQRYPFYVYWLFDLDLLARYEADLRRRLEESR